MIVEKMLELLLLEMYSKDCNLHNTIAETFGAHSYPNYTELYKRLRNLREEFLNSYILNSIPKEE